MFPVPLERDGPARIELRGWNQSHVDIAGDIAEAELVGPATYIETVAAIEDAT
jgi:hypothetical protein